MAESISGKVAVGCKLPHGLEIHLDNEGPGPIDPQTGQRPQVWTPGTKVTLLGTNAKLKGGRVVNGFGVTENVDAAFMSEWMKRNANLEMVKNGLIIVGKNSNEVRAESREKAGIMGIETIDPEHPERHNGPDTQRNVAPENYEGKPAAED